MGGFPDENTHVLAAPAADCGRCDHRGDCHGVPGRADGALGPAGARHRHEPAAVGWLLLDAVAQRHPSVRFRDERLDVAARHQHRHLHRAAPADSAPARDRRQGSDDGQPVRTPDRGVLPGQRRAGRRQSPGAGPDHVIGRVGAAHGSGDGGARSHGRRQPGARRPVPASPSPDRPAVPRTSAAVRRTVCRPRVRRRDLDERRRAHAVGNARATRSALRPVDADDGGAARQPGRAVHRREVGDREPHDPPVV